MLSERYNHQHSFNAYASQVISSLHVSRQSSYAFCPIGCLFHSVNPVLFNLTTQQYLMNSSNYKSLPHVHYSFPFIYLSHHFFLFTYFHPYFCPILIFTVFHYLFFTGPFSRIIKRDLASSCLSVRPQKTNLLPLNEFSWNFNWEFFENLSRKFKVH